MIFNYVIYHKNCTDGFTSLVILSKTKFMDKNSIILGDNPFSNNIPLNLNGKNVIIMDVSYKKSILEEIKKKANYVLFIDHHISNIEDIKKLESKKFEIIYNINECSSTLVWNNFFEKGKYPKFVRYVKDNDLGIWKYPKTLSFITALRTNYNTNYIDYKKWYKLFDVKIVNKLIELGNIYLQYKNHIINIDIKSHVIKQFPNSNIIKKYNLGLKEGQYTVCVINNNSSYKSDLMNELLKKITCDFVILWYYIMNENKYIFSMRSNNILINIIAKKMGGGGHEKAAAFSLTNIKSVNELFV